MISPADLEKVEFSVAFRGYNGDQVDDYIDMVVKEFTALTEEYEKYKLLCERQNEQIKIMRQKILELETKEAFTAEPVVISEPKEIVKTVVKTVVDTKVNKEAIAKAKQLEQLSAEFKAKALELYNEQLARLEELSFDFNEQDYVVEANGSVEEEPEAEIAEEVTAEAFEEATEMPAAETVEETAEEVAEEVVEEVAEEVAEEAMEEPAVEAVEEAAEEIAEEAVEEATEEAVEEAVDETILSADEIDALCGSDNADINNILDELSGLFEEEKPEKTEAPVKKPEPAVIQQSFDSLFITSVDDSE